MAPKSGSTPGDGRPPSRRGRGGKGPGPGYQPSRPTKGTTHGGRKKTGAGAKQTRPPQGTTSGKKSGGCAMQAPKVIVMLPWAILRHIRDERERKRHARHLPHPTPGIPSAVPGLGDRARLA